MDRLSSSNKSLILSVIITFALLLLAFFAVDIKLRFDFNAYVEKVDRVASFIPGLQSDGKISYETGNGVLSYLKCLTPGLRCPAVSIFYSVKVEPSEMVGVINRAMNEAGYTVNEVSQGECVPGECWLMATEGGKNIVVSLFEDTSNPYNGAHKIRISLEPRSK